MQCTCGFPEAVPLASTDAKRADSRENRQKPKIPYGNDAPRARERNLYLPSLPRPRGLETRKQRGFPHSHRDDCCCDPLELKLEPRMNTGDVTDSCTEPKSQKACESSTLSARTMFCSGVELSSPTSICVITFWCGMTYCNTSIHCAPKTAKIRVTPTSKTLAQQQDGRRRGPAFRHRREPLPA